MKISRCSLTVIDQSGKSCKEVFDGSKVQVIGRGSSADIAMKGDFPEMSRRHLYVEVFGNSVRIQDAGSSCGISVNGKPITTQTEIGFNQHFKIGPYTAYIEKMTSTDTSGPTGGKENEIVKPPSGMIPVAIAACVLLVACIGVLIFTLLPKPDSRVASGSSNQVAVANKSTAAASKNTTPETDNEGVVDSEESSEQSTVYIQCYDGTSQDAQGNAVGMSGSGFVAGNKKTFVTNLHVVADYITSRSENRFIQITIDPGTRKERSYFAKVAKIGDINYLDLAILVIHDEDYTGASNRVFEFGDASSLVPTQKLVCKGFPGGGGTSVRRDKAPEVSTAGMEVQKLIRGEDESIKYIQVGGNITHGSSGGPVFDEQFKLMGVVVKALSNDGELKALIPSNVVKTFVQEYVAEAEAKERDKK